MSETRRGFLGGLGVGAIASMLPGVTLAKTVVADKTSAFVVVELPPDSIATNEVVDKLTKRLEDKLEMKVLVIPSGAKVDLASVSGVYQREKLGEYEYEISAKNEEDLRNRYQDFINPKRA